VRAGMSRILRIDYRGEKMRQACGCSPREFFGVVFGGWCALLAFA